MNAVTSQAQTLTGPQLVKVLQMLAPVSTERMQGIGFAMVSLVAQYLQQETPKRVSLSIMRQVMGLPPQEGDAWATIDWSPVNSWVQDGQAVIKRRAIQFRTVLTRLRAANFGLNITQPQSPTGIYDLYARALSLGYQPVPPEAFDVLVRAQSRFNPPGWVAILLPALDGMREPYRLKWLYVDGGDGQVREMNFPPSTGSNWSIAVATQTNQFN